MALKMLALALLSLCFSPYILKNLIAHFVQLIISMLLRSIVHITLALWLLMVSTGIPIYKHFCKDAWKGTALFIAPSSCHDKSANCADAAQSCCSTQNSCCSTNVTLSLETLLEDRLEDNFEDRTNFDDNCCDDTFEFQKFDKNLIVSFVKDFQIPSMYLFVCVLDFLTVDISFASFVELKTPSLKPNPPPLLAEVNLPALLQTFLL